MFTLPTLSYAQNALEPAISSRTIEFHYGKHHQAYVNNLNNLIQGTPFEKATLEEIINKAEGPIFNNAAQVWNHTFYFSEFSPKGGGVASGALGKAIEANFGSFEAFKEAFNKAATTLFGSGWVWLVKTSDGKLAIVQTANAESPLRKNQTPILTCDVWEHAYYLDYQNRRPDYVSAFWNLVDWDIVGKRF